MRNKKYFHCIKYFKHNLAASIQLKNILYSEEIKQIPHNRKLAALEFKAVMVTLPIQVLKQKL